MKLNKNLILMMILFLNVSLFAQDNYTLTGIVSDASEVTLIGVNIVIVGTSVGTSSDYDGSYELQVKNGDVIEFSYTGYTTQTIAITNETTLNVTLIEGALLEEVVIVGYGTRKKSHSTGAIAKIGGEEIAGIQASRVDEALAGKLPGVLIQNQDGAPGSDPKIQIRAASSVSGNSNPLIVVDGYPITGSLATVNPNDIQSLEILKDAASAAIYGSRGANGVILVTTKKGKSGKPSISYNTYISTSHKYVKDAINPTAGEWAETVETNVANGTYNISELDAEIYQYRLNAMKNSPDVISVEDWLFQNGNSMNHDLSISGGSEDVKYFASLGYLNTKGIVQTQGFKKYNARLNLDANLGKKFKTGFNMNGFIGDRDIVGHDMRDLMRSYSIHPVYHTAASIQFVQDLNDEAVALGLAPFDDGFRGDDAPWNSSIDDLEPGMTAQDWHYGRSGNGIGGSGDAGPATKLDNTDSYQKTIFGNFNTYLQYEIIEGLTVKTVLGADLSDVQTYFWKGQESDSQNRGDQTNLNENNVKTSSVLSETTLSYNKALGKEGKHDVGAVIGVEFQNKYTQGINLQGTNVPYGLPRNFELLDPDNITVTERDETIARRSVFGRVNYAYDNRYLGSVSVRRDGDSRFGANNRYETFPAFSLGWNVHNESFYESNILSDIKLRFSYGSLGTVSFLGAYNSLSLLNPQATNLGIGYLIPDDVANADLTWQTNTEINYGLNLGFLGNRFRLGFDYYTSDIEDMLIKQSVSEVLGTTTVSLNSGDVRSSGLELEVSGAVINNSNFTWDVNANFSTVNTEITDLGGLSELAPAIYGQSSRGPVFRNYVGGEIGEMWGIETTGEVEMKYLSNPVEFPGQQSGWSYVVDQQSPGEDGYGEIDITRTAAEGGDLVKIGQNTPDFYWGIGTQVGYKDFDLSIQIQGAAGAEVYNIDPLYYGSQWGRGLQSDFDADGDGLADHNGLRYGRNRDQTDSMIQDASYASLRNMTIGYTFNPELVKKAHIGSLRLYVAATNLFYIMGSDYTSLNPEGVETTNTGYAGPTTYGVQVGASPTVRSFTFGLNLTF